MSGAVEQRTRGREKPTLIVEARYWPMSAAGGANFTRAAELTRTLNLRGASVFAEPRPHPFDHYDDRRRDILHLEVRIAELRVDSKVPDRLRLRRLFLRFWRVGMLTSYAVFEAAPELEPSHLDDTCASAVGVMDDLQPDVGVLLTDLRRVNVLTLSDEHLFGVPRVLDRLGRHSALESYRYSNYIFFGERDRLEAALAFYSVSPAEETFVVEDARVYMRWAHYLWDASSETAEATDARLEARVAMDYLSLSEAVVYDNATECNRGFLDVILDRTLQHVELDSSEIRATTLLHHRLLLEIRLWRSLLDQREQRIYKKLMDVLLLEEGKRNFETSDNVLRYAIDSLDVREQRDADRLLAIALGVFTALTTFSAAADLNSLLRDDGTTGLGVVLDALVRGPFSLRTVLLAMATAGAGVALAFLAADRAVRRRIRKAGAAVVQRVRRVLRRTDKS
jgi:hypothetical protein